MTGSRANRPGELLYWFTASTVILGVTAFCGVAAKVGWDRFGDSTTYFYERFDVGHPGVVNVVTAMGFVAAGVIGVVLAMAALQPAAIRATWIATAILLLVLALDDLLRLHNMITAGDVLARGIYWVVLVVLARRLRPLLHHKRGAIMVVFGIAMLVASEIIDILTPGDSQTFSLHPLFSVAEESFACLGAWSLAIAGIGFTSELIVVPPEQDCQEPQASVSF